MSSGEGSLAHLAVGTRFCQYTAEGKQAAGRTSLLEPGMLATVYLHQHSGLQHTLTPQSTDATSSNREFSLRLIENVSLSMG